MKKQSFHRLYNFPDADLYVQCIERLRYAMRDKQKFKEYGYEESRITGLAHQCEKFKHLPDDDELIGDQMVTTEKKNTAAERLQSAIRGVMTRVEMKYNNRTGRYRKFGTAKMGDMSDAQLLFCGRRVVRVARQQIDFFAEVGLNENIITKVQDAHQAFENALNIQQDRISDRDISVESRIELGNKIYQEMIVLCNIGKDIWDNEDPVYYEQYCVYESNNEQKKARKNNSETD